MLPPALLNAADRLAAILMVLVDAISPIARGGSTSTFSEHTAKTLFVRLVHLITTLIRINNFGIRAPAKPAAPKAPSQPAPITHRSGPAQRLPTHPGWLLAALPDIAPAIAADLTALLADPALAALFAATPTLHRTLRPLLRGLGLGQPPSNPPPQPGPIRRVGCPAPHQSNNPAPIAEATFPPASQATASNRPDRPKIPAHPYHYDIATMPPLIRAAR